MVLVVIFFSTEFGRIMLLLLMCISFVALDVVYATVVMNYCVQCFLLVFYVDRIQEKIRERTTELLQNMKVSNHSEIII